MRFMVSADRADRIGHGRRADAEKSWRREPSEGLIRRKSKAFSRITPNNSIENSSGSPLAVADLLTADIGPTGFLRPIPTS